MERTRGLYDFLKDMYEPQQMNFAVNKPDISIEYDVPEPMGYVEPTISMEYKDKSPLLLISAAGAMGKSKTSEAIAHRLHCPRLDLAKVTVGANTHMGTLSNSLAFKSFGEFIQRWDEGQVSLVIDSLDEAPLRSGERAYFAFLESLIETASGFSRPANQIIVLGRPQTIDLFRDYCKDYFGMDAPVASLDALSLNSSLELIDIRLSEMTTETAAHRAHPVPARLWWTDYLMKLGGLIAGGRQRIKKDEWRLVDDFLGYPPVLTALAPTLERQNYASNTSHNADGLSGARDRSEILIGIVTELSRREAAKVQVGLKETFGTRLPAEIVPSLYTHEEQIQRVLQGLGYDIDIEMPAHLPEELRSEYEENLQTFVGEHPYLDGRTELRPRNVVFSDYLRALIDSEVSVLTVRESRRSAEHGLLPIGPFYARFIHTLCGDEKDRTKAVLRNEDLVDGLVQSWKTSATHADDVHAYFLHPEGKKPILDLVRRTTDDQAAETLYFEVEDPSGILTLTSPVSEVSVVTEYSVVITPVSGSVSLGPRLTISAKELEALGVQEVLLLGSIQDGNEDVPPPALITDELRFVGDFGVKALPEATRAIVLSTSDDRRFRDHSPKIRTFSKLSRRRAYESILALRRIFTSFRGQGAGTLSINGDKFSKHVIGRSPLMQELVSALRTTGFIRAESGLEILEQMRLGAFHVSYDMYQNEGWEEKLLRVLEHCIRNDMQLSARLMAIESDR